MVTLEIILIQSIKLKINLSKIVIKIIEKVLTKCSEV